MTNTRTSYRTKKFLTGKEFSTITTFHVFLFYFLLLPMLIIYSNCLSYWLLPKIPKQLSNPGFLPTFVSGEMHKSYAILNKYANRTSCLSLILLQLDTFILSVCSSVSFDQINNPSVAFVRCSVFSLRSKESPAYCYRSSKYPLRRILLPFELSLDDNLMYKYEATSLLRLILFALAKWVLLRLKRLLIGSDISKPAAFRARTHTRSSWWLCKYGPSST